MIQLLPVDVIPHACVFTRPLATLHQLRAAHLDVLIDCAPWTRLTAVLTAMANAGVTVGYRSAGQYIHSAFDIAVPYLRNRHEVENHRAIAELFGPLAKYDLRLRTGEQHSVSELPFDRLVLMHMFPGGSRAKQKSWPVENWIELAREVVKRGWVVGFTGAQADLEAAIQVIDILGLPEECCISLVGQLSLPALCDVMSRARLLVTIDTGVAHVAAALNVSIVGLYGPTRIERWGSCNARAMGINSPHPAAGYINYGFEHCPEGDEVMASLSVNAVLALVEAALTTQTKEGAR